MKYILAATGNVHTLSKDIALNTHPFLQLVLSCLVINNAEANVAAAISLRSEVAAATTAAIEAAGTSTSIQDSVDSLSSVGYAIEVPDTDGDEDDSDENSPALPAIPEEDEEDDDDEDREEQDVVQDMNTRENAYAKAGLKYNKDVDLPVLSQRKQLEGEDLPAVPQVVACRTDGQVAITYVSCQSHAKPQYIHINRFNRAKDLVMPLLVSLVN